MESTFSVHSERIVAEVASRLRAERARKRLTLNDMERATGIPRATVNNYERGRCSPRVEHLIALASALGVDTADLIPESAPVAA
jgi:transcriptional regulator with XRE-family HTH domain